MSEQKKKTVKDAVAHMNVRLLDDDEVDAVTGGAGTNSNDLIGCCSACGYTGKKIVRKEGGGVHGMQLICEKCHKTYENCPVCGAAWKTAMAMETWGLFVCTGGHNISASVGLITYNIPGL